MTSTSDASSVTVDKVVPTGGSMTLAPASPVAASSALTVSFTSWTDASTPLQYAVLINDVVVSAQGSSASRNLTAPATPGSYTLKGRIYDALGNMTETTQSFEVIYTPQQQFDAATTADVRTLTPCTGTAGLPVITVPSPGIMRVEYLRRIGSGVLYTPRKSTTLAPIAWQLLTAPPQLTPIDTNWERVRHDEVFNPLTTQQVFGSVEATLP